MEVPAMTRRICVWIRCSSGLAMAVFLVVEALRGTDHLGDNVSNWLRAIHIPASRGGDID